MSNDRTRHEAAPRRHGVLQTRHKPELRQAGREFFRHAAAFCREMDKAQKRLRAPLKNGFSLWKAALPL
jgi:hypothetical protein